MINKKCCNVLKKKKNKTPHKGTNKKTNNQIGY